VVGTLMFSKLARRREKEGRTETSIPKGITCTIYVLSGAKVLAVLAGLAVLAWGLFARVGTGEVSTGLLHGPPWY